VSKHSRMKRREIKNKLARPRYHPQSLSWPSRYHRCYWEGSPSCLCVLELYLMDCFNWIRLLT
jgi:hypothetical protein